MTTKKKIIIGLIILAVAAIGYYFFVYKPAKDKETTANGDRDTSGDIATGIIEGSAEAANARGSVGDPKKGYWKVVNGKKEWYIYSNK